MNKPARILHFKCEQCGKFVKVFLQKLSTCAHIQAYQGICDCGTLKKHATGDQATVKAYLASEDGHWSHHH